MSFKHGRKGEIWLDAVDVSGFFSSVTVGTAIDVADASVFKAAGHSVFSGQKLHMADAKGYYDPTSATVWSTIQEAADSVLTVGPAGMAAIGDLARLIAVATSDVKHASPVGGMVGLDWAVTADGDMGFGYTLHPLSTDAGTTTGATRDDLASSANGWIAHVHYISFVSNASWVVKIQDSANGSTWADVTNGAFPANVSVAGAARLVVSGTLREFVRYVATATGGTSPTMTFGLAIARL